MKTLMKYVLLTQLCTVAVAGQALKKPDDGSISIEQGLKSWAKIYDVVSHPRCVNCHVGSDNYPMWSGPSYGKTRRHGMNINAGNSRMGVESVMCSTCHTATTSEAAHGAPGVKASWRLAPVAAAWFGKSSDEICQQLRDPNRNGNRSFEDVAAHLNHDVILHWAWQPGGKREPAPYSLDEHVNDIMSWGWAGVPCPSDSDEALTEDITNE